MEICRTGNIIMEVKKIDGFNRILDSAAKKKINELKDR